MAWRLRSSPNSAFALRGLFQPFFRSRRTECEQVQLSADKVLFWISRLIVRRTNSKATLRLDLSKVQASVPAIILEQLKSSRYYAHGRDSLVIQSDTSRRQNENKERCFTKLAEEIELLARNIVTGETSAAQRARVKNLYVCFWSVAL